MRFPHCCFAPWLGSVPLLRSPRCFSCLLSLARLALCYSLWFVVSSARRTLPDLTSWLRGLCFAADVDDKRKAQEKRDPQYLYASLSILFGFHPLESQVLKLCLHLL